MTDFTIYLAGPIFGCTDAECADWRALFQKLWPGPTINPLRRDYRGRETTHLHDIVELDKADILRADAVVVSYDKPSVGTSMEILFAWERGKPVVVVARPETACSPWLHYHSHRLVHSYPDAVQALLELLQ